MIDQYGGFKFVVVVVVGGGVKNGDQKVLGVKL